MRRHLLLALLVSLPTAAGAQPAVPVATAEGGGTDQQIAAWLAEAADPPPTQSGAEPPPRAVHGEVEATMGSGGYRGVRAAAVMPLGDDGALGVAVADEHLGRWYAGADRRSFALSLQLGANGASAPACGWRHSGVKLAEDIKADRLCGRTPVEPTALEPDGGAILR
jgi:hypothetical protein